MQRALSIVGYRVPRTRPLGSMAAAAFFFCWKGRPGYEELERAVALDTAQLHAHPFDLVLIRFDMPSLSLL